MSFAHFSLDRPCFAVCSRVESGGSIVPRWLGLLVLLVATNAGAVCFPGTPAELYVGNTTADAGCTQSTIQAAIDAATCTYGTNIHITHELTYPSQHLNISGKNVTLIGRKSGDSCGPVGICDPGLGCEQPPPGPRASIGGHSGDAVVTITGTSTVAIQYLDIVGATQAPGFSGGGIAFVGSGSLTIDNSTIRGNQAASGGGIYFNGTGSVTANLNLLAYTQILLNIADDSGGGILVAGKSVLKMLSPQTVVQLNHAPNGSGGGIAVIGPARAFIGSAGIHGNGVDIGVLSNNTAAYGGGLALVAGTNDGDYPLAVLFTTEPTHPVEISNNTASHTGGGVYMKGYETFFSADNYSYLCAWDFRIAGNIAAEGAAIYADVYAGISDALSAGSIVQLGNCNLNGQTFPTELGAVACKNEERCNTIDGNEVDDPTQGSAILVQTTGYIAANRFSMRGNRVAHALRIVGNNTQSELSDCLIANNGRPDLVPPSYTRELIYATGNDTQMTIESCTFANNLIGSTHVIHTESDLTINDSIIAEPGTLALDYSGNPNNLIVNYVVANDVTTLPVGTGVIHGTPTFMNAASGDYHLRPGQYLGVDLAPMPSSFDLTQGIDLDGKPRTIDLPSVINAYGPRDIGPYELQNLFRECGASDSIFCDGYDHP